MFTGLFYNHQVAKAIPVNIQVLPEGLLLRIAAADGNGRPIHWLYTALEAELVDRNFIRITDTGDNPGTLEVNNADFVKLFLQFHKPSPTTRLHQLVQRGGLKWSLGIMLILIALALLGNFILLPWWADIAAEKLPHSIDKQLGEMARSNMNEPVDTAASRLLTAFAAQMQWDTEDTLTFTVVSKDIKNAYALPDGYIVVYTGLLKKLKTPEQLAALLSHEVAHVSCRHSVRTLCRNMSSMLIVNLLFSGGGTAVNQLYANAASLNNLRYSRQNEAEADIVGLATLRHNHVNQEGMLSLMQTLQKLDPQNQNLEFISTHPLTDSRVRYIKKEIAANQATFTLQPTMDTIFQQLKNRAMK
ncbi:MAG: M48 family metallopeptidase [Chitinophaga sp.]|uniref:M48 family metallopeptidase n=1 Tax=Chitinophaga sp. TaxID=1869181 RepID=UPI0025BB1A3C|nr:M48 family metallopeptidase [Chitinophaga sp.]MBV8253492.1 M48 family metallopeptidase [Chitinophaga sp.]